MKAINTSVLFLLLASLYAERGYAQHSLVGKWELVYAEGGMHSKEFSYTFPKSSGSWLIMLEDGSYQGKHDSTGIVSEGTWMVIEPNTLKLNLISVNGVVDTVRNHITNTRKGHKFKLEGDTLVITTTIRDSYTINKYMKR